jgi:hypothetical protein
VWALLNQTTIFRGPKTTTTKGMIQFGGRSPIQHSIETTTLQQTKRQSRLVLPTTRKKKPMMRIILKFEIAMRVHPLRRVILDIAINSMRFFFFHWHYVICDRVALKCCVFHCSDPPFGLSLRVTSFNFCPFSCVFDNRHSKQHNPPASTCDVS